MGGSISLDRRLLDWEWHDEPLMGWLWVNLLLMANHKDNKWHGIVVERGQLVTSRDKLAAQTGLSNQQLRTRLTKLEQSGCITIKSTNQFTTITICKYDSYQHQSSDTNQRPTGDQPTINQQSTTNNNDNNLNTHTISAREGGAEDRLFNEALQSQTWVEAVCMKHHLSITQLKAKFEEFRLHSAASDKLHAGVSDVREHFNLWLLSTTNNGTNNRTSREQQNEAARTRRMQEYATALRNAEASAYEVQDERPFD